MNHLERHQRIQAVLGFIAPEQVLTYYSTVIMGRRSSRKGGEELDGTCPFHDSNSMNFTMNSKTGKWLCRSASCGKRGDLIHFIAYQEGCSWEQAYLQLCFIAGIVPEQIDDLSIALALFDKTEVIEIRPTPQPMLIPRQYRVFPHPYLVRERLLDPAVLERAHAGGIYHDDFYRYRACIPVMSQGNLFSIYSRRVSDDEAAWQRANPKYATKVKSMFRRHDYTGASLTSHFLYGLDEVEGDTVILVEAIISVLRLRTIGIPNAVALMKAEISSSQVKLLIERGFSRILICGDNDLKPDRDQPGKFINPGMRASWKTYHRLKRYADVGIVKLPFNRDPADTDDPFTRAEFQSFLDAAEYPARRGMEKIKGWLA